MAFDVIVLPGEGIGREVTAEAVRVLEWFAARGLDLAIRHEAHGSAAFASSGRVIAPEVWHDLPHADAVLFGATGGPDYDALPEDARKAASLLAIRRHMGVFANLRPVRAWDELADAIPLKPEVARGTDLLIVRELNGGLYFGEPRGTETAGNEERAFNTLTYTAGEIERIARVAFELAGERRGQVHSVDKSNVLETHRLWRKVVARTAADYAGITLDHILVDNCAMQLVRAPRQFDVLVTDITFGDILSDLAGGIAGSIGLLPSASLGAADANGHRPALYEPVHGSAPDIAGRGIANPIGAILSVAMMLHHSFARPDLAQTLEEAVRRVLGRGIRTADIQGAAAAAVSTRAMGDAILGELA